MLNKTRAINLSATSFLNSFFLESLEKKMTPEEITLPIAQDKELIFPLKYFSLVGRHHYSNQFFLNDKNTRKEIGFFEMVQELCHYFKEKLSLNADEIDQFTKRLHNSVETMQEILDDREDDLNHLTDSFIAAEQGLYAGHSFHPTPKSRSEFSLEDNKMFSPELKHSFPLVWYLVKPEIYFEKSSSAFDDKNWARDIFAQETEDLIPFPMHPWQERELLKIPDIKQYIASGEMKRIGEFGQWQATSSVRTVYSPVSNYMLKFSLNVKLTNSIRHLLQHELDRGLQVHEVFNHEKGLEFSERVPEFHLLQEPVYAGIKSLKGSPIQESFVLARENPFQEIDQTLVLATLTQDHPDFSQNIISTLIHKLSEQEGLDLENTSLLWFEDFLHVAIKPLIIAQAEYGILLGSHQQNMLLYIQDNRVMGSYFRDCNGTGYSELGTKLFAKDINLIRPENGNILNQDAASFLFGYYTIINSTFNVIGSIAHSGWASEETLLKVFRLFLTELKNMNFEDNSFLNYLLDSSKLKHKGNFFCSLRNINENTAGNPLSIYTDISNPILKGTGYEL